MKGTLDSLPVHPSRSYASRITGSNECNTTWKQPTERLMIGISSLALVPRRSMASDEDIVRLTLTFFLASGGKMVASVQRSLPHVHGIRGGADVTRQGNCSRRSFIRGALQPLASPVIIAIVTMEQVALRAGRETKVISAHRLHRHSNALCDCCVPWRTAVDALGRHHHELLMSTSFLLLPFGDRSLVSYGNSD